MINKANLIQKKELIKFLNSLKGADWAKPSDSFKHNARIRLLNIITDQTRRQEPTYLRPVGKLLKSWRLATVFGLILFFLSSASVIAAQSSLPGDKLYPLKIASEQALLAVTPFQAWKIRLASNFANRRLEEMFKTAQEEKAPVPLETPAPQNAPSEQSVQNQQEDIKKTQEKNENIPSSNTVTEELKQVQDTINQLLSPATPTPEPQSPTPSLPSQQNLPDEPALPSLDQELLPSSPL